MLYYQYLLERYGSDSFSKHNCQFSKYTRGCLFVPLLTDLLYQYCKYSTIPSKPIHFSVTYTGKLNMIMWKS